MADLENLSQTLQAKLDMLGITSTSTLAQIKEAAKLFGVSLKRNWETIENQLCDRLKELTLEEVWERKEAACSQVEQVEQGKRRRGKDNTSSDRDYVEELSEPRRNAVNPSWQQGRQDSQEAENRHEQNPDEEYQHEESQDEEGQEEDRSPLMELEIKEEELPQFYRKFRPKSQPIVRLPQAYIEFLMPRSKGKLFEDPMSKKEREEMMEQHPIVENIDIDPPSQPIAVQVRIDQDKVLKKLDKHYRIIQSMGLDVM
jgi:hypothetical protein